MIIIEVFELTSLTKQGMGADDDINLSFGF